MADPGKADAYMIDAFGAPAQAFAGWQTSAGGPAKAPGRPHIIVTANGDGSFALQGTGFTPKATLLLRAVDTALIQEWGNTTADGSGKFSFTTAAICRRAGKVFFSATDGRANPKDLTGNLWSNTVTSMCGDQPPPDDDDGDNDPDNPEKHADPDPPADPAPDDPPADPPADPPPADPPPADPAPADPPADTPPAQPPADPPS